MKWIFTVLLTLGLCGSASAESCGKSREYILDGLAGGLSESAVQYQQLFKVCLEALTLGNVKDAYVLKDGGIAVVPARNTMAATAGTLAQFCQRFPKGVLRFLTPRDQKKAFTLGLVVMISSKSVTTCQEIRGQT